MDDKDNFENMYANEPNLFFKKDQDKICLKINILSVIDNIKNFFCKKRNHEDDS